MFVDSERADSSFILHLFCTSKKACLFYSLREDRGYCIKTNVLFYFYNERNLVFRHLLVSLVSRSPSLIKELPDYFILFLYSIYCTKRYCLTPSNFYRYKCHSFEHGGIKHVLLHIHFNEYFLIIYLEAKSRYLIHRQLMSVSTY